MEQSKTNLFVYGSLRDPQIFKSVCGLTFCYADKAQQEDELIAEPAFLPNHRRVSPDNVYYYAVEDPSSRIEGYLIHDVPLAALAEIDWYEGKRYKRQTVEVYTADKPAKAIAYCARVETMKEDFGDRWHVNLIQELWLRKRIEELIEKSTRPGDKTEDADLERRAHRQLLGTTERDLVISQHRHDTFSDFYIGQEINQPRPSIIPIRKDPAVRPYITSYLDLLVRYVLLNEFEEKIREKYRYQIDHIRTSQRYYWRSISLLAALRMLNASREAVDVIVQRCIETRDFSKHDLIDYVKYAIKAADGIFDARIAKNQLELIRYSAQPGLMPLGAELELSNVGAKAVENESDMEWGQDHDYDDFRYFYDFYLDVLSWKMGGCVDDHTGQTSRGRRKGFLEFAPGRLNISAEISRPATSDPWVLNQLITNIVQFHDVAPHSLHLSFQMRRSQIGKQKILPLGFIKCMLILGGGLEHTTGGNIWVSRVGRDEITQYRPKEELAFSLTSKRKWFLGKGDLGEITPKHAISNVYQYKFVRLERRANYEPLILCLKGLQLSYNPADYLTREQLITNPKLRRDYRRLRRWASKPTPISHATINKFLAAVQHGLSKEGHGRAVHKPHYINWALNAVSVQLRLFNQTIRNKAGS